MVDDNVKQVWYTFWGIEGTILLSFLWLATLVCKWVMRRIFQNWGKQRPHKHAMLRPFGTPKPPRNSESSGSETADLAPGDIKSIR